MSGFPRRSETFALNELLALDAAGALEAVFATKPGDDLPPHPDAERLAHLVEVLPAGPSVEQGRIVAERLQGRGVVGIHGYFAHKPAAVAIEAAMLAGIPYGFSLHARDARKIEPDVLAARAKGGVCVIACNEDVARDVGAGNGRVQIVPHGVDLRRFRPSDPPGGSDLIVLAVGRLVEKKGFHIAIDAAARVTAPLRLRIVGEGPERARLEAAAREAGLEDRVEFRGGRTHAQLPREYAEADVLVAPSVVDGSGDRDGLPNVILEAMASGRPVVGTPVGAIGSAIADWETGLLVPPADPGALAAAIETLATQPTLREQLGRAGHDLVRRDFGVDGCTARFLRALEAAYG
jgi:glycosyltransferase involved in cell wall biosynthesis